MARTPVPDFVRAVVNDVERGVNARVWHGTMSTMIRVLIMLPQFVKVCCLLPHSFHII